MKKVLYLLAFATMFGCGEGESQSLTLTTDNTAVVLVDLQYDFTKLTKRAQPNLGVKGANQDYINGVKNALEFFEKKKISMIATQDWHNQGNISFASTSDKEAFAGPNNTLEFIFHDGKRGVYKKGGQVYTQDSAENVPQEAAKQGFKVAQALWPDHCEANTEGAKLVDGIARFFPEENRVKKGQHLNLESYSGFYEGFTDKDNSLGLNEESTLHTKLQNKKIKNIIVFGLATDYCVAATAIDGVDFDYNVIFVSDLSKGVGDTTEKCKAMTEKGVKIMTFEELKNQIK